MPVRHTFQSYSHSFVSFDNTSIFGLVYPNTQVSPRPFIAVLQGIAAGIGIPNFLRAVFHGTFEFFNIRFNEKDTT